ncbi:hypothetical protein FOL47_002727 [Perkinsus chesapeaki]|uniref:Uncharacterized protein n=1 Tax=Perkinsus chesapeaki TaxID=330153 RepID=A0A7J6MCE1_PERCH|nr:hypothetical protein FOL47_002727 [Perkinsus chesapeaki]
MPSSVPPRKGGATQTMSAPGRGDGSSSVTVPYSEATFQDLPSTRGAAMAAQDHKPRPVRSPLHLGKWGLMAVFVIVRGAHTMTMEESKVDGRFLYNKATPVIVECVITFAVGLYMAYSLEGPDWLRKCLAPESFKVFSLIGALFGIGDILEMQSMSAMDGAVYQVLGQSKLIVTAVVLWAIKGQGQTALEWVVLALIVSSMSAFVIEDHNSAYPSFGSQPQEQQSFLHKLLGVGYVMSKVTISCVCAVLADKYMKKYSDVPFYIQMAQYKIAWFTTCFILAYSLDQDGEMREYGFFHGWTISTWAVAASFTIKGWCTMYLLRSLDSVLKNIGEALAVIVVYLCSIIFWDKTFDSAAFLSMSSVVLAVVTYTLVVRLEAKKKRLMLMLVEIQDDVPFTPAAADPSGLPLALNNR